MNVEQQTSKTKFTTKVSIKPFVQVGSKNMGLEKWDMAVHDGVLHEEPVICLEQNGIKRYITGLNEFAPEIKNLDTVSKKTKIKQIRERVILLEKELASNVIDIKDEKFWEKVQIIRPDNFKFWDQITIQVGNKPVFFSPATNPHDLIKITAIENKGFSLVAPSLEAARKSGDRYKFYLDKEDETVSFRTEVKKLRNRALSELQVMFEKNQNKLFYVCKAVDVDSIQYKKKTPFDILYENMDDFINGQGVEPGKRKAAEKFLNVASMDMETLKLKAIVKDSNMLRLIGLRGDGHIYHLNTNTLMGKNQSEVVDFLKSPLNDNIFKILLKEVENNWANG